MYITIIHKETAADFFLNLREHTSFENWFTQVEPSELVVEMFFKFDIVAIELVEKHMTWGPISNVISLAQSNSGQIVDNKRFIERCINVMPNESKKMTPTEKKVLEQLADEFKIEKSSEPYKRISEVLEKFCWQSIRRQRIGDDE